MSVRTSRIVQLLISVTDCGEPTLRARPSVYG
jgi:hypothetical protein